MTARISLSVALALALLLPAGALGAGPSATTKRPAKAAANSVASKSVRDRSLRGLDLRKGAIQVGNLNLTTIPDVLQSRVAGTCADGEAMRAVARDGTVTCVPLLTSTMNAGVSAVRVTGGLTGGGGPGEVTLGVDPAVVQSRVTGACQTGEVLRSIAADGGVGCQGVLSEVNAGTGLAFSAVPGRINLFADTDYLQRRVTGACTGIQAIRSIAGDGAVDCGGFVTGVTAGTGLTGGGGPGPVTLTADPTFLQRRVTGTCLPNAAVRSVAQDGTVTCTTPLASAGRVLTGFPGDQAPGNPDVTILTGPSGILLRGRCLTGPTRAEVYLTAPGNLNLVYDSRSLGGSQGGGTTITIGSTTGFDRGDFDVSSTGDANLHGQFYAAVLSNTCQFSAGGIAGGGGLARGGPAHAAFR